MKYVIGVQTKNKLQETTNIDVEANLVTEHESRNAKNQAAHGDGEVPQEAWHNTTAEKKLALTAGRDTVLQHPPIQQRNCYASVCLCWDYCISSI